MSKSLQTLQILLSIASVLSYNYSYINLPVEHLPVYFSGNPEIAMRCLEDDECPYKEYVQRDKCWGYEYECDWDKQYSRPHCPGDHRGWVKTKELQERTFYTQADFGYVKQQMDEMKVICEPLFPDDSSLECSEHMRFCRGRNLILNFTALATRDEPIRYKMDVFKEGDVGGYCKFYKKRLESQLDHMSPLQSWAPELRYFTELHKRPIPSGKCDVVIEKPTFIMKIDAINMYHHFCDFVNLYASQHLNSTCPGAFSTDVHILIWESFTYHSSFKSTFQAFTQHPIWDLKTFRGETVCFKNIIFPLLPRMIFGLYYNTPLIYGCENSGLFHAFSKHILHRLEINKLERQDNRVRVTLLSRDTKYRRILNEDELVDALEDNKDLDVRRVVFNRDVTFRRQLEIIKNTDVLIGIHGAGLTHLMFLPDWGSVFELYNCEDANCYMDLTRLRGLKYITWQDSDKLIQQDEGTHPEGGAHAKFTNYSFDVKEFMRLVNIAVQHVMDHPKFIEELDKLEDENNIGELEKNIIQEQKDNIVEELEKFEEENELGTEEEDECENGNVGSADPIEYEDEEFEREQVETLITIPAQSRDEL